jgi:hypothetical protein
MTLVWMLTRRLTKKELIVLNRRTIGRFVVISDGRY